MSSIYIDSDAEEAFDAQLAEFKKSLYLEAITFYGSKMKPNVSEKWLLNVKEYLKRINEAIAVKSTQQSSAYWGTWAIPKKNSSSHQDDII